MSGSVLDLLSLEQAIALALPGMLLTVAGQLGSAAQPEMVIARRGFQVGYAFSVLLSRCRSASGRRGGS